VLPSRTRPPGSQSIVGHDDEWFLGRGIFVFYEYELAPNIRGSTGYGRTQLDDGAGSQALSRNGWVERVVRTAKR